MKKPFVPAPFSPTAAASLTPPQGGAPRHSAESFLCSDRPGLSGLRRHSPGAPPVAQAKPAAVGRAGAIQPASSGWSVAAAPARAIAAPGRQSFLHPASASPPVHRAPPPQQNAGSVGVVQNKQHGLHARLFAGTASPFVAPPVALRVGPPGPMGTAQMMRRSNRISDAKYFNTYVSKVAPSYIDKHGNRYWTGFRTDVRFENATIQYMNTQPNARVCVTCLGIGNTLDHIVDFSTSSSGLGTVDYCDGANHFRGVPWQDAQDDYNNTGNLQWMCLPHNSSKSGAHGLYTPPQHLGACPGGCGL
jgi:hypothetical protein